MTLYTILTIAYVVAGQPAETRLVYTSEVACGNALATIHQTADPAWTEVSYHCTPTGVPSKTPRPKARGD
jgi:hypothetical protein